MPASQDNRAVMPGVMSHGPVNRLLVSLPADDYARITPSLRHIALTRNQVLVKQDEPLHLVYFLTAGVCSLVKTLQDRTIAEVATIGSEGAIGTSVFFGQQFAECDVLVQQPCECALVMDAHAFKAEMDRRGAFFNHVIRYNQALMSQIMQTITCNGLHSAEQRCCRWLLMTADRTGRDEFLLTHEFLAEMLGVRRPTVTLIAERLQKSGLIQYRRGSVTIADRSGMEAASCECYQTLKTQMRRLLPDVDASLS